MIKYLKEKGFVIKKSDDKSCIFYEYYIPYSRYYNEPYISVDGDTMYVYAKEAKVCGSDNPIMLYCGKVDMKTIERFIEILE